MAKSGDRFQSWKHKCSGICLCTKDNILQKSRVSITYLNCHLSLTKYRAYEIKRLWKRDPPPVEILEKLTAKGGDILSRTMENFQPPRSNVANGESDSGGEEARTPKDEKMDTDEPGSGAGGRSSRGEQLPSTAFV